MIDKVEPDVATMRPEAKTEKVLSTLGHLAKTPDMFGPVVNERIRLLSAHSQSANELSGGRLFESIYSGVIKGYGNRQDFPALLERGNSRNPGTEDLKTFRAIATKIDTHVGSIAPLNEAVVQAITKHEEAMRKAVSGISMTGITGGENVVTSTIGGFDVERTTPGYKPPPRPGSGSAGKPTLTRS